MIHQEKFPSWTRTEKKMTEGEKIRRQIIELRKQTGAVEVRLHHMPLWMMRAAWPHVKHGDPDREFVGWNVAGLLETVLGLHLDHWGTSEKGAVFVNEPYPSIGDEEKHREVARLLGLGLTIPPNSWWYPGWTVRFEFRRRTDSTPDARKHAGTTSEP